jgi:hypothetical protein
VNDPDADPQEMPRCCPTMFAYSQIGKTDLTIVRCSDIRSLTATESARSIDLRSALISCGFLERGQISPPALPDIAAVGQRP